jgi:5-methylcytosine-specific restriction endonuclease McrA
MTKAQKKANTKYDKSPKGKARHAAAIAKRKALRYGLTEHFTGPQFFALCFGVCLSCHKYKRLGPDHVIPLSKGGTNDIGNIQPLCITCNKSKYQKTTDYRML